MQITVKSIEPELENSKFPKMYANVSIYDEKSEFHNSAEVHVFINKRDVPISELAKDATLEAIAFLKIALSSHSS